MKSFAFLASLIISLIYTQPVMAQWFSQSKEDPFGDNHIVGAVTAKYGKGLIVRCIGGSDLQLMFLPNEVGTDDVVTMANAAGTLIKVRIDKEQIDEIPATVQLTDGKVLAIADINKSLANRMANARRRIAVVLDILGNQFGSTSFGVRGSGRHIKKVLDSCVDIQNSKLPIENEAFRAVNNLKKSTFTDPKDGARLIKFVAEFLERKPYKDKIVKMIVESAVRPHKVSAEFILDGRLEQAELAKISKAVRGGVGEGFKRYFVGFRLQGDDGGYWATAHHDPTLEVKILGVTAEVYNALIDRVENYKPKKDEEIIADAVMSHGFTYHLVILKSANGFIARRYHETGNEWGDGTGIRLKKKGDRYWEIDNSFGENYRIHKGMIEIHDEDGIITKSAMSKR